MRAAGVNPYSDDDTEVVVPYETDIPALTGVNHKMLREQAVRGGFGAPSASTNDGGPANRVCMFYLSGNCMRGPDCSFRHPSDVAEMEAARTFFMSQPCMHGADCRANGFGCLYYHAAAPQKEEVHQDMG